MITKEQLRKAIDLIEQIDEVADKLYNDYKIEIAETPMFQVPGQLFDLLIECNYTSEGADIIYWWCFECNFGRNPLNAEDKDGHLICQTFDELYEYCKQYERI